MGQILNMDSVDDVNFGRYYDIIGSTSCERRINFSGTVYMGRLGFT